MKNCNYLFVYGTLRNGFENEYVKFLQKQNEYIGRGYFFGQLYDAGAYPGAICDPTCTEKVYGDIILLKSEDTLDRLDIYEGIDEATPQPHEYKRAIVDVFKEEQIIPCWTYLYNFPVHSLKKINSGDYLKYLNASNSI